MLAVNKAVAVAIAEMTVQSVGISDRNGGNARRTRERTTATVTDGLVSRNVMYLEDGGLQRAHAVDGLARVITVESESKATHVELALWEVLNARRIVDVSEYLVRECGTKLAATLLEEFELVSRELVEGVRIATYEMREDRTWDDRRLMFQTVYQLRHILQRVKAETVHASIQLDVYREVAYAVLLRLTHKGVKQAEGIDLRLQVVIKHGLERRHLRVHNHDV